MNTISKNIYIGHSYSKPQTIKSRNKSIIEERQTFSRSVDSILRNNKIEVL